MMMRGKVEATDAAAVGDAAVETVGAAVGWGEAAGPQEQATETGAMTANTTGATSRTLHLLG